MRDFRDAKAMARTLRAALAAKGLKVTISQSLELVAEIFGVGDWNTLAAAIHREELASREKASQQRGAAIEEVPALEFGQFAKFSAVLERTLHRALTNAQQRKHEYATLEHLVLALSDDVDASEVMKACDVDIAALRADLVYYVDNDLKKLATVDGRACRPTAAFQRVVQRAENHAQNLGRTITGGDLLSAIFYEKESPAAWLLGEQGLTHQDATNFILHSIKKASGRPAT